MESAPKNVQVRPLSSSMMMITWEPPETPNGQVTVRIFMEIFKFDSNFANVEHPLFTQMDNSPWLIL